MEYLHSSILGLIQGATELLPVSSTGHLVLFSKLFDYTVSNFSLVTLHLGTTIAIAYFYRDILFHNLFSREKIDMYLKIGVASIPAVFAGYFLNSFIEEKLRATSIIAISLLLIGLVMIVVDNMRMKPKVKNIEDISFLNALTIGIGQMFALVPGTSRSGITSLTGIFTGLEKYLAFQFSFLMGLPVLLGSFLYELIKSDMGIEYVVSGPVIVSIIVAGVVGYLSLHLLKKFSKKKFLSFFGWYRVILGIVLLLLL